MEVKCDSFTEGASGEEGVSVVCKGEEILVGEMGVGEEVNFVQRGISTFISLG